MNSRRWQTRLFSFRRSSAAWSGSGLSTLLPWAVAFAASTAFAQEAPPETVENNVDSYRLLWERNIFDPTRTAARPPDANATNAPPPEVPTPDKVALTGTFLVGTEHRAFFEGTTEAFNTHGKAGDPVGPFAIESVDIDTVAINAGEQRFTLAPGEGLVSTGEGTWKKDTESGPIDRSRPANTTDAQDAPTGGALSVLEELKARRQQELNP